METFYEFIVDFLKLLNANQGILIVIFTFILVMLNRNLARETKRLREAETEPNIEVYLLPARVSPVIVNMVVRNTGGAAREIKWDIIADASDLESHGVPIMNMSLFKILSYLPASKTIEFFLGRVPKYSLTLN